MGANTDIEWADSTINLAMGCNGCKLYNPAWEYKDQRCYAFFLTQRYRNRPGWVKAFDEPKLFLNRIDQVSRWRNMSGVKRPKKPWLDNCPRHIFHGDMGDYWTYGLPEDWLIPSIPQLAAMPHVHMFLTKRVRSMCKTFSRYGSVPPNFALGTTVIGRDDLARAAELFGGTSGLTNKLFLSVEPLWEDICTSDRMSFQRLVSLRSVDTSNLLVIVGGESGKHAKPFQIEWAMKIAEVCNGEGIKFFMKQTGSRPYYRGREWSVDGKGKLMAEFPSAVRRREMWDYE